MKIYRIQNEHGIGPYMGGHVGHSYFDDLKQNPTPYEDGMHNIPHCYHFGFQTLNAAEQWFDGAQGFKILAEHGYHLVVLEVPEKYVILGDNQLAFDPYQIIVDPICGPMPVDPIWNEQGITYLGIL